MVAERCEFGVRVLLLCSFLTRTRTWTNIYKYEYTHILERSALSYGERGTDGKLAFAWDVDMDRLPITYVNNKVI